MGKILDSEIKIVNFQDPVDSYPHRTNYDNIKNRHNELVDTVAAATIGTTNAETTAARPYHTNLKDRLDSIDTFNGSYIKSGGAVTVNVDTSKVDVALGEAKIAGVDTDWAAQTSASFTAAAASNHRIDLIAANSDNTISVLLGPESLSASTNPVAPVVSATQIILAVVYVDDSAIDLTGNIYNIVQRTDLPILFVKQDVTIPAGRFRFGSMIIDADIELDFSSGNTSFLNNMNYPYAEIICDGTIYLNSTKSITVATSHTIDQNTDVATAGGNGTPGTGAPAGMLNSIFSGGVSGIGANGGGTKASGGGGGRAEAGGGGGGGASITIAGGDGGDAPFQSDGGAGSASGTAGSANINNSPVLILRAYDINIDGSITITGANGNNGTIGTVSTDSSAGGGGSGANASGILLMESINDISITGTIALDGGTGGTGGDGGPGTNKTSGGGGGGGGAAGSVFMLANEDITISAAGSISAQGGDGGNGGAAGSGSSAIGGDGGNGSDGGILVVRSKTYSNSGTITITGGIGGTAGSGGTNGTTGTNSTIDQKTPGSGITLITDGYNALDNIFSGGKIWR